MTNQHDAEISVASDGPQPIRRTDFRLVISLCGSGTCPTIYHTDRDTLLVQGYAAADVAVPDGEFLVEIPRELLIEAARRLQPRDA